MRGLVGVLGGMGPLATVDFFRKVIEETPASVDQDHIPLVIDCVPDIPCRVAAILRDGPSPLPQLKAGVERLQRAGAECVVIACNTAHHWHDELARPSRVPILHIVDAVAEELAKPESGSAGCRIGLLGTEATLASGMYPRRLQRLSGPAMEFLVNAPEMRQSCIVPAIALVKSGRAEQAGALLEKAVTALREQGAERCILACTELPVALDAIQSPVRQFCIDATRALARASVRWSLSQRPLRHS